MNVVGLIYGVYIHVKANKQAQTYSQMDMWYRLVYIKKSVLTFQDYFHHDIVSDFEHSR